jgi:hypothetical protein
MRLLREVGRLTFVTKARKNLKSCRSGAAATEMALVLPLLTTMILAVFEYGTVIYSYSLMQFGANRVARTVAVNRMTPAQAQADVRVYLPGWVRDDVTVTINQSNPADTNSNLVRVQLSVAAADATPMALLTRMVPWQLSTDVVMKQELPYVD